MPQPYSSRDDIKGDVFQEWVTQGLEWIATHRQTFFSIVGTIAVGIIVLLFVIANFRNVRRDAWERYSAGQNWINANNPANALNTFNEVINNYSRTPAAVYSLMAKGDLLHAQRNFTESVQAYNQCLEKGPKKVLLPFVYSGLGSANEDGGNYPNAITAYKQFVNEFPNHYLAPKIYESLARVYELSLNPDAAKEIYEKIITMFPGSPWAQKARVRYQLLSPQPFLTSPGQNIAPPIGQ